MTLKTTGLFLLFQLLLWGCTSGPEDFIREAGEFSRRGEYEEAIGVLDEGLQQYPSHPGLLIERGITNETAGDSAAGFEDYQLAVAADTCNLLALSLSAENCYAKGDYAQAIHWFNQAIFCHPEVRSAQPGDEVFFTIKMAPGNILGNPTPRETDPYFVEADYLIYFRACARFYNGDYEKALRTFQQYQTNDGRGGDARWFAGYCCLFLGDTTAACAQFTDGSRFYHPQCVEAWNEYCAGK